MLNILPSEFLRSLEQYSGAVLFVGAGLSKNIKKKSGGSFPSWPELNNLIVKELKKKLDRESAEARILEEYIAQKNFLQITEMFYNEFLKAAYGDFFRKHLDLRENEFEESEIHRIIAQTNYRGIVTTNLDPALELHGVENRITFPEMLNELYWIRNKFYAKIHGCIQSNTASNWVLTQTQYEDLLKNELYKNVLGSIYTFFQVITVGYGLTDPDFLQIQKYRKEIQLESIMPIYALLKFTGTIQEKKFFENKYGIVIIPYNDHHELKVILSEIQYRLAISSLRDSFIGQSIKLYNKISKQSYQHDLDLSKFEGFGTFFHSFHLKRVKCSVYQTVSDLVYFKDNSYYLSNEVGWEALEGKFSEIDETGAQCYPAGGWYLVREQAEFLLNQLVKIFNGFPKGATIKILEAGAASFVHHYTYVSILLDALKICRNDLKLELTIIDFYHFPLHQIKEVGTRIILSKLKNEDIEFSYSDSLNLKIRIKKDFIEFINSKFDCEGFNKIKWDIERFDLSSSELNKNKFKFDVITEHFLTVPVIDHEEWITAIRKNYSSFCDSKLYLIVAYGNISEILASKGKNYVQLHEEMGFKLNASQQTWDPYDLKDDHFNKSEGDIVSTINTLSCFEYNC